MVLLPANYTFLISYIGFQTVSEKIELSEDKNELQPLQSGEVLEKYSLQILTLVVLFVHRK
jgi:hypothetical protein